VNTLVDKLDLHNEKSRKNTIIIIGAFEHHSNILPWQETGVDVR
jgi:selenocysteine lyase/cysteine desulfurase